MAQAQVRKKRIEPLWNRVDRNRWRLFLIELVFLVSCVINVWILLAVALVATAIFGARSPELLELIFTNAGLYFAVTGLIAVIIGATWMGYALSRSEKWLLARLDAALVPTGDLLPTKYALKDMAIASGFRFAPALYIMETDNVNAFVFAHRERRAVVGVTRGLVERMGVDEQRAVFANMMARLKSGDIATATVISALVRPLWAMRERDITRGDRSTIVTVDSMGQRTIMENDKVTSGGLDDESWSGLGSYFLVAGAFIVISEIVLWHRRRTDLRRAEKADAEGMLLLKDPQSMLSALEKAVRFNNWVPNAGPGFAQLFYCWTGDDTDDESDPEWQRVTRLREVLGAEGMAPPVIKPNERVLLPPPAPRVGE